VANPHDLDAYYVLVGFLEVATVNDKAKTYSVHVICENCRAITAISQIPVGELVGEQDMPVCRVCGCDGLTAESAIAYNADD